MRREAVSGFWLHTLIERGSSYARCSLLVGISSLVQPGTESEKPASVVADDTVARRDLPLVPLCTAREPILGSTYLVFVWLNWAIFLKGFVDLPLQTV